MYFAELEGMPFLAPSVRIAPLRILLVCGVLGNLLLSGCTHAAKTDSHDETRLEERIEVVGKVFWVDLEGGFLGLQSSEARYRLEGAEIPSERLPQQLQVTGVLLPPHPNIKMWGQRLQVTHWQPVPPPSPAHPDPATS